MRRASQANVAMSRASSLAFRRRRRRRDVPRRRRHPIFGEAPLVSTITSWWGWLYGRGPPPAPFMGASRRMVTMPNFTTWSNDTEQVPLEITSFPRACVRNFRARRRLGNKRWHFIFNKNYII